MGVAGAGKTMLEKRTVAGKPKPRIDDVANLAGVSIKTVSRVLNEEPNVSEVTRHKVLSAIQRLDYRPCLEARRLAGSKNHSPPERRAVRRVDPDGLPVANTDDHGQGESSLHAGLSRITDLRRRGMISHDEFELQVFMLLAVS